MKYLYSLTFLVKVGNTSVDDPDASVVLHSVQEMLATEEFKEIRDDIFAVRAPPEGEYHHLNTWQCGY